MAFNPARWLPSAAYRKAGIIIASTTLHGAVPATATNYTTFFIAPYKCVVLKVDAVWGTASTAGTVNVEKLVDGQAQDGGVDLLSAAINTALVANTLVAGTLIGGANASRLELAIGDRLGLVDGGNVATCANLTVTVTLAPIP